MRLSRGLFSLASDRGWMASPRPVGRLRKWTGREKKKRLQDEQWRVESISSLLCFRDSCCNNQGIHGKESMSCDAMWRIRCSKCAHYVLQDQTCRKGRPSNVMVRSSKNAPLINITLFCLPEMLMREINSGAL